MQSPPQFPLCVRVIDNVEPYPAPQLALGGEYVALGEERGMYIIRDKGGYLKSRFKPVVRVKMGRAVA